MRVAVVMPRGSQMSRAKLNSMETVAGAMLASSRLKGVTRVICDGGAPDPVLPDLVTVPEGLSKSKRADAVARAIEALDPIYVEYHQQLESSAALARRLPGRVHVLYRHTRIKPPRGAIGRMRYEARLAVFDQLIFVSEAARTEFVTDYPRFADRASAICNPIDAKAWAGDPTQRDELIVFSGRAMAEKGLEPLCLALEVVLDRFPTWKAALMLGDWDRHEGWAQPRLQPLERFGSRVVIGKSASLAQVKAVTRRAAIAVTPSFVAEALGLSALEAHAAGAALISSGRGGLREASGSHAVYVEDPQAPALVEALTELITNPAGRLDLARSGQAFVAATHSPVARSAQLDDLRERLMRRRTPSLPARRNTVADLFSRGSRWIASGSPWATARSQFADEMRTNAGFSRSSLSDR
ncbi:glycosyltransferase family 4 protein [Brevundimonas sp.]|uniref:glycosyltransferase family 4 protein n=1 Tax=Brevundimonas sp. TaxID=1871086 RepID=UPI003D0AB817